ncbi:uncharacterized protein LOC144094354 isoform X2 [Amblyomma americanum]
MSDLLSHRPLVQARMYGVDSAAEADIDLDSVQYGSCNNDTPGSQTNEEDIGSFADLNASGTSFTSAPPAKRRRTKESHFEDLLTTMKKNMTSREQREELQFQREQDFLKQEQETMKGFLEGISNSFLQGTQALMTQFFSHQQALLSAMQPQTPMVSLTLSHGHTATHYPRTPPPYQQQHYMPRAQQQEHRMPKYQEQMHKRATQVGNIAEQPNLAQGNRTELPKSTAPQQRHTARSNVHETQWPDTMRASTPQERQ